MSQRWSSSKLARALTALTLAAVGILAAPLVQPAAAAEPPTCANAGVTVTQMHGANKPFYISSPLLSGSVGWTFSGGAADTTSNLWVNVGGFSSSNLSLNSSQPASFPVLGRSSTGKPLAYAYLTANTPTATKNPMFGAQTWAVTLWRGDPNLTTSSAICTFSDGVSEVYQAAANNSNKPLSVSVSGTPVVGSRFTVTVTGSTGTISAGRDADPRLMTLSPSMGNDWPAGAYQLIGATTTFDAGAISSAPDVLRLNFAASDTGNRNYTIVYTFYVRRVVAQATTPVPRQGISSGKDTVVSSPADAASTQQIPATVLPGSNGLLTKTISSSTDWTNREATYTVAYRNTGSELECFDSLEVDPTDPDGWTYKTGTSTFDGSATGDPAIVTDAGPTHLMFQAFCVPSGTVANPGTTTFTFTIKFTSSLTITARTTISDVDVLQATSQTASLVVNVKSTTFNEEYDGVEVGLSRNGGPFTYKTGVTDANGSVNLGAVDPNSNYQVKLKAPCDNRPEETETAFDVTTGAATQDYTLVATVPCAPTMTYRHGDDTLTWTHPNDGGSQIRYYTFHYNTPARINKKQPWGIFARHWPADINEVPLVTYGPKNGTCPLRSTQVSPLPYNLSPECLRPLGEPPRGQNVHYRVAARNAVPTTGVVNNGGAGWGPMSADMVSKRPIQ